MDRVERVARAICVAEGLDPDWDYDPKHIASDNNIRWRCFVKQAEAAIAAIPKPSTIAIAGDDYDY